MKQVEERAGMRYLGMGRAQDFPIQENEVHVEQGRKVYAVPWDYFCPVCEGAGCKTCKWTGARGAKP